MELSEKERVMLEKERDEIRRLTSEILALENDPKNSTKLKQDVIGVQSAINKMASYSNLENRKLENIAIIVRSLLFLLSHKLQPDEEEEAEKQLRNPSPELLKKLNIGREEWFRLPFNPEYPARWAFVVDSLNSYCCYVNSIQFDFTKKGLTIVLPKITFPRYFNLNFLSTSKQS
jgi:hypothetical protein